jgi:4-hydroxybenzoate polyprenyltransferase
MSAPTQKSTTLIKIIALLSLVRWYNVLLVGIALFLSAVFLLNINTAIGWREIIVDYRIYFEIIAISFFIQAGYLINAFYDFEKDIINKPKETIFGRIVSKRTCINAYILFVFLGLLFSYYLGWKVLVFNFFFSFLLWYYSHRLRKITLLAEITAASLTIIPFVSLYLIYPNINSTFFLYSGFIFAITLTREIVKKMVSLKGDLIVGEQSFPIVFGIRKTKYIILFLMLTTLILISLNLPSIFYTSIVYFFYASILFICLSLALLIKAKTPKHFDKINTIYKVIIGLSIFSMCLI